MTAPVRPRLVVIVGPIAAGKSTLAADVGRRLRERGESVAVVGLDSVAEMAQPTLDWDWAHEVHAHVVGAWLATSVRTVIAEGPSTPAELDLLMRCVPGHVAVLTVVLVTRWDVALERALQDPDRGLSRDPGFLRGDHDRFERGRRHLKGDLTLDSAVTTPPVLAQHVVDTLDGHRR